MNKDCCKNNSNFKIYKPLFIVVGYILLITIISENLQYQWNWMHAMNTFMGAFFLAFSFFKMLDIKKFAEAFRTYDPITKIAPVYGYLYPFIELTLGIFYICGCAPLLTNMMTFTLLSIGSIGVAQAVIKQQQIQCACLGTVFNLPMTKVTIVENTTMILMALVNIITFLK